MFSNDDEEELQERYPEGSAERRVLDYSRSSNIEDEVPPMLAQAFMVLMGITVLMAVAGLVTYLSALGFI